MKKFLKENWFKLTIALAFLIVAVCVGYYLVKPQEKNNGANLQTKCEAQAQEYISYEKENPDSQVSHYNKTLNKCLLLETSPLGNSEMEALIDVSNKTIKGVLAECTVPVSGAENPCSISTDDPAFWDMRFVSYQEFLDYIHIKMGIDQ